MSMPDSKDIKEIKELQDRVIEEVNKEIRVVYAAQRDICSTHTNILLVF